MSFALPFLASAGTAATATAGLSTLGWASLGLQALGAISSASAKYDEAKQQSALLNYQAAVQRNNAAIAEEQAKAALIAGQRDEFNQRLKQAAAMSRLRASYADRGMALDEGTPLNALASEEYIGEVDALTIRDNANRQAWAHRISAASSKDEADMLTARAKSTSPSSASFGTLLTGATSVASSWLNLSKQGVL